MAYADTEGHLHADARRFDAMALPAEALALALAALEVLDEAGWPAIYERARGLAERLAAGLRERGRALAPRDDTTLVSFVSEDPVAESARLGEAGIIVRSIPERPWVRASVGAWNDEGDLDRLLAAL
jgi:L-cysteine/cystine lyase